MWFLRSSLGEGESKSYLAPWELLVSGAPTFSWYIQEVRTDLKEKHTKLNI